LASAVLEAQVLDEGIRGYEALATPGATPKRLDLLKEGVPALTRVVVFGQDEYTPHRDQLRALEVVTGRLRVELGPSWFPVPVGR